MPNDKSPPEPETVAHQETCGGCQQEPCSLSSGSEADAAFPLSINWNFPDSPEYLRQRAVAVKLENERNKMTALASDLAAELREVRTAIRLYRDAKGRYHTQLVCERLLALLPENVESIRAAQDS